MAEAATAEQTEQTEQTERAGQDTSSQQQGEKASGAESTWRDSLPEDVRDLAARYKGDTAEDAMPEVFKSLAQAKAMVGADTVAVPGKNAPPEKWAEFYNKIGRPEKADGYELPTENLPEGFALTDEQAAQFREVAHDVGLTPAQTASLYRHFAKFSSEGTGALKEAMEKKIAANDEAIRKEYGDALDEKIDLARRGMRWAAGDDYEALAAFLSRTGMENDPAMVRIFHKVGRALAEDEVLGGGSGQRFRKSPAEAKAELLQLKVDQQFQQALHDRNHPGHKAAVDRRMELFKIANPETGA